MAVPFDPRVRSAGVSSTSRAGSADAAAKSLLTSARSHLGWREGANNDNPFTRHVMGDAHQPWCAAFVSTLLEKENIPGVSKKMFSASARGLASQFQSAGRYLPAAGNTPQPGDAIFFGGRGNEHHVGIVEKVENGKVYTVEGNSSDKVSERVYNLNDPGIGGYGRVFGDGQVSSDVGVDTSAAGRGTAGNAPSGRAQGRGSYHQSMDTGLDPTSYFMTSPLLLKALIEALRGGDPSAIAAALGEMLPNVSTEDLADLAKLLEANPALATKIAENPDLVQQLAANPTPEGVQAILGSGNSPAAPAPAGWGPRPAATAVTNGGGWKP